MSGMCTVCVSECGIMYMLVTRAGLGLAGRLIEKVK